MKLTAKRRAWLEKCRDDPLNANRPRGPNGYRCMIEGWTEWNYIAADGSSMTQPEAKQRFGDQYWNHVTIKGERITAAGLAALGTGLATFDA